MNLSPDVPRLSGQAQKGFEVLIKSTYGYEDDEAKISNNFI